MSYFAEVCRKARLPDYWSAVRKYATSRSACNSLAETAQKKTIGLPELTTTLLSLASNYFWPLLERFSQNLVHMLLWSRLRRVAEILFEAAVVSVATFPFSGEMPSGSRKAAGNS